MKVKKAISLVLSFALLLAMLCAAPAASAADAPESAETALKESDYIVIGSYAHKTADGYEDSPTPIVWQVAAKKNGFARLVSRFVLDEQPLDPAYPDNSVSILNSPLEQWMNTTFYNAAFTDVEKIALVDYDELFYTLDENNENYSGYYYRTGPGVKVAVPDYYYDGYFNYASRPLGLGNQQASHLNMRATLKDGTLASYWTGTTSAFAGANHVISATADDASLICCNSAATQGVRPMIKVKLNNFTVTGSGTLDDPYVMDDVFDTPDPTVWEDASPSAALSGTTLTLSFADGVKLSGNGFGPANFSMSRSDGLVPEVVTAKLANGKLILELDQAIPAGVDITLKYEKPKYSFLLKDTTLVSDYVDTFSISVTNNAPGAAYVESQTDGFYMEDFQNLMDLTDADLDPGVAAWGGHQSRIVRTNSGVYALMMVDVRSGSTGDAALDPAKLRKFQLWKIDGEPSMLGERVITGQATSLVAGKDGSLYVACLDKINEGDAGYGVPTLFKFIPGTEGYTTYRYDTDDAFSNANTVSSINYEAVSVDNDGNILYLSPSVNHVKDQARLIWTRFDVTDHTWSAAQPYYTDYTFLYPYILPKSDGSFNVVAEIGIPYSAIEVEAPDGYTFLVNEMRMWSIPDWNSAAGVQQVWDYKIPFTEEQGYSQVQNASFGDSYVDSKGYTHTIMYVGRFLGMDVAPRGMVYVVFDQNNNLITQSRLFLGASSCRFAENKDGDLFLLRMANGSNIIELYAANSAHTQFDVSSPVFSKVLTEADGTPISQSYSGISVTSPRGGSATEDYVDCMFPSSNTTEWRYFRLYLGVESAPPVDEDVSSGTEETSSPPADAGSSGETAPSNTASFPDNNVPSTGSAGLVWPLVSALALSALLLLLCSERVRASNL